MNRTLLILAGALIVGGLVIFGLYMEAYIEEETGGERVLIVTAAQDIEFGEPMQISWLTTSELPQSYVEDRHLRASDLRRLIGVPLSQSVRSGEAVLRTDLSTLSDQQRTLSGEIPQGMRALGIEARPDSSHAGLLRPGDRVDVLLTVGDPRIPNSGRAVVVAQNVLVLSTNRAVVSSFDDDRNTPTHHAIAQISIEVGLEDAQRVTLAQRQGMLRIVLRNANDASEVTDPPDVLEAGLLAPSNRQEWLRRFAFVQRPDPPPALEPVPEEVPE